MDNKEKKPFPKFDVIFFSISAIIIVIIGIRFHELNLISGIGTFLLVGTAPFIYKYIDKKYGEEKKFQSKLDIIDTMTEKELSNKIASIYTNRGFSISYYDSVQKGVHMVCQRKGVRNGEDFVERGLVLVIHTTEMIDYSEYLTFLEDIKDMKATQGMMVTNSRFSPEIMDEAKGNKVALWGRQELREKLNL